MAYTTPGAPTISINKNILIPNESFILSWEGASHGTDNIIVQYKIYYKDNENPTIDNYDGIIESGASTNQIEIKLSETELSRGTTRYYKIQSIGNYSNSSLSDETAQISMNKLPTITNIILLNGATNKFDNTQIKLLSNQNIAEIKIENNDFNAIKYSYQYRKQNETKWYSCEIYKENFIVPNIIEGENIYYFRAFDGLEYGEEFLYTIEKNFKLNNIELEFILSPGQELNSANNNTTYIYTTNVNYSIENNEENGLAYKWYIKYFRDLNDTNNNYEEIEETLLVNNYSKTQVNIIPFLQTLLGEEREIQNIFYTIGVALFDGYEASNITWSSEKYFIPSSPIILSGYNNFNNKIEYNDICNFYNQLGFYFSADEGIKNIDFEFIPEENSSNNIVFNYNFSYNNKEGYIDINITNDVKSYPGEYQFKINFYRDVNKNYKIGSDTFRVSVPENLILNQLSLSSSIFQLYKAQSSIDLIINDFFLDYDNNLDEEADIRIKKVFGIDLNQDYFKVFIQYNDSKYYLNNIYQQLMGLTITNSIINDVANEQKKFVIPNSFFSKKEVFNSIVENLKISNLNQNHNINIGIEITNLVAKTFSISTSATLKFLESLFNESCNIYYNNEIHSIENEKLIYENDILKFRIQWQDYNTDLIKVQIYQGYSLNKILQSEDITNWYQIYENQIYGDTVENNDEESKILTKNFIHYYSLPEIKETGYLNFKIILTDLGTNDVKSIIEICNLNQIKFVKGNIILNEVIFTPKDENKGQLNSTLNLKYVLENLGIDKEEDNIILGKLDKVKVELEWFENLQDIDKSKYYEDFIEKDGKEFITQGENFLVQDKRETIVLNINNTEYTSNTLQNFIDCDNTNNNKFILENLPNNNEENWSFYYIRLKVTTTMHENTKVFYSIPYLVYNITPTVSYRKNCLGINTHAIDTFIGDSGETDAIVVIGETTGRTKIYFTAAEHEIPFSLDISTGELNGFIINGGEW